MCPVQASSVFVRIRVCEKQRSLSSPSVGHTLCSHVLAYCRVRRFFVSASVSVVGQVCQDCSPNRYSKVSLPPTFRRVVPVAHATWSLPAPPAAFLHLNGAASLVKPDANPMFLLVCSLEAKSQVGKGLQRPIILAFRSCACNEGNPKLQQFCASARFRLLSCGNSQSADARLADRRICPVR